jgi:hypothetical protein
VKNFYSCVDTLIPSPLSEQHLIIKNKAQKESGAITAYASEEYRAIASQPWIFQKLSETKDLDGVVFFTANQFNHGNNFNLKLFNKILNNNYEIHFAREDLSFSKKNINTKIIDYLFSYSLVIHKNENELFDMLENE